MPAPQRKPSSSDIPLSAAAGESRGSSRLVGGPGGNRTLVGCADYFFLGPVGKAYLVAGAHTRYWLRQWLSAKHKFKVQGASPLPYDYLDQTLGPVRLQLRARTFPWATTWPPCPNSRLRDIRTPGLTSGM